jgi:D-serine deaminase-like pyridoxal phosphate-dependent protein
MQLQLLGPSAVGMCCQKVTEAEAMVAGGIHDVFISNEVVAAPKITRMVALAAQGGQLSDWQTFNKERTVHAYFGLAGAEAAASWCQLCVTCFEECSATCQSMK